MSTEERNIDSTKLLTQVESKCTVANMVRFADIEKAFRQQVASDLKYLKANYVRQNKLRPAVLEFRDLEDEAKVREERLQRIAPLIGDDFHDVGKVVSEGGDVSNTISFAVNVQMPLWAVIRSIIEQVPEMQVVELQHALEHFGRKSTRQAIESALAAHKDMFDMKTRNREKFVSLKR